MSSDGGALLLRAVDRRVGLTRRLAACFADHRNPSCCEHSLRSLLAQRLFGLALGYEDINDHERLREDNLLALAVGIRWPVPAPSTGLSWALPNRPVRTAASGSWPTTSSTTRCWWNCS